MSKEFCVFGKTQLIVSSNKTQIKLTAATLYNKITAKEGFRGGKVWILSKSGFKQYVKVCKFKSDKYISITLSDDSKLDCDLNSKICLRTGPAKEAQKLTLDDIVYPNLKITNIEIFENTDEKFKMYRFYTTGEYVKEVLVNNVFIELNPLTPESPFKY